MKNKLILFVFFLRVNNHQPFGKPEMIVFFCFVVVGWFEKKKKTAKEER